MAHMDRMVMVHVWGMREEQNSKRAREKISNKAPREPMDAMCQMGLKWLSELLHTRTRPGSGCLSIVKLSRHHQVVVRSTILASPRIRITCVCSLSRLVGSLSGSSPVWDRVWVTLLDSCSLSLSQR